MTNEQLNDSKQRHIPAADDDSPDWRKWTAAKCERERHRVPELDAELRKSEQHIQKWRADFERHMQAVDPAWRSSDSRVNMKALALLAHRFNLSPRDVANMPAPEWRGLVDAYAQLTAGGDDGKAAGDEPAAGASDDAPKMPPASEKAASVYRWAMIAIPHAEHMTIPQLHEAIIHHPDCPDDDVPEHHDAFRRNLNRAGIYHRKSPKGAQTASRSVVNVSDLHDARMKPE